MGRTGAGEVVSRRRGRMHAMVRMHLVVSVRGDDRRRVRPRTLRAQHGHRDRTPDREQDGHQDQDEDAQVLHVG